MAGAGKKRAKAERNDRGSHTGGQSSRTGGESVTTGEPISHTAPSSTVDVAPFDGPPHPSSSTGGPADEGRGRSMSNIPSHSGSRTGSMVPSAAGDMSKKFQELQINKNVDYPASVYNMYSQVSPLVCLRRGTSNLLDCP